MHEADNNRGKNCKLFDMHRYFPLPFRNLLRKLPLSPLLAKAANEVPSFLKNRYFADRDTLEIGWNMTAAQDTDEDECLATISASQDRGQVRFF